MTNLPILLGLVVAIPILLLAIILLLANLGAYFTKIAQGTTSFITRGKSLRMVLPNIGGYRMSNDEDLDGRHWLIPEKNPEVVLKSFFHKSLPRTIWFQKWLWKQFGVRFISVAWPHTHVHWFDIRSRKRLAERNEVTPDAPLRSRVVESPESTKVDHLLFLVPRPVYLEGVELAGDNARINLLLLPIYRQVIPTLSVYYLKGDFFSPLDGAIEAAMVDFFSSHRVAVYKTGKKKKKGEFYKDTYDPPQGDLARKEYEKQYESSALTYSLWLKLTKGGEGSPIEVRLRTLNVSAAYRRNLKSEEKQELVEYIDKHLTPGTPPEEISSETLKQLIPSGIVPRFGFALVSFRVVEWEAHESTIDLAKALLQKETELHTAEGVRQKAYGQRDAILALAEGESSRYLRLVTALVDKGVNPDIAADVVATQLRTENVRDSRLTTYVEGGGRTGTGVMIPASPPGHST